MEAQQAPLLQSDVVHDFPIGFFSGEFVGNADLNAPGGDGGLAGVEIAGPDFYGQAIQKIRMLHDQLLCYHDCIAVRKVKSQKPKAKSTSQMLKLTEMDAVAAPVVEERLPHPSPSISTFDLCF